MGWRCGRKRREGGREGLRPSRERDQGVQVESTDCQWNTDSQSVSQSVNQDPQRLLHPAPAG